MSKTFSQNISHVSQQINSVFLALAGAERIFALMDETPEVDEGYVTLVNAKYDENGNVTEIDSSELCRFIALIYRVWVDAKTYTWIKNSFEKRGIRLT